MAVRTQGKLEEEGEARKGEHTGQSGVEVDDADAGLLERLQERRREDVHPPREDNQLGLFLQRQDLLGQRSIVPVPRIGDLLGILLALWEETAAYKVKVLPGDA